MFGLVGSPENHLYDISRGEIEHVDENQAEGDKEDNPGRDNVLNIFITAHVTHANNDDNQYRRDEERHPAHHDEHGGWKVDGQDERTEGAREADLKTVNTVVTFKKITVWS